MPEQGTRTELAAYRLEEARNCLNAARIMLEYGDYKASANRSYYCIFHSMRAVLALTGFDSKKHSGIISEFRKEYIRPGIFDARLSKIIDNAFDLRGSSDYDDFYIALKSDVENQLADSAYFLDEITSFLSKAQ